MKQTVTTFTLVAVIIGLITIVIVGSNNSDSQITQTVLEGTQKNDTADETNADILYWGTTCPHCHETIEWIEENNIEGKISIVRKEVYNNQTNSLELSAKAKSCGLDEMNIGVPFMYTRQGECLIGTPDITKYLEQEVNQDNTLVEDASASAKIQEGEQQ